MSPRKKNMLEAFQASLREQAQPADPPPRRPERAAPEPSPPPDPALAASAAFDRPRRRRAPEGWVHLALGLGGLALLAVVFWLGRYSALSEVAAAEGANGAAAKRSGSGLVDIDGLRDPEPAPPADPPPRQVRPRESTPRSEGRTAAERAFFDPRNRFTIRAIYYDADEEGKRRFTATYRHLQDYGLPVVGPIQQGDILVLCVGAAPTREGELTELRDRLRGLPGPPPQNERAPFEDAFFVNIDSVVQR